jgi:hypothetical protein
LVTPIASITDTNAPFIGNCAANEPRLSSAVSYPLSAFSQTGLINCAGSMANPMVGYGLTAIAGGRQKKPGPKPGCSCLHCSL